MRPASPGSLTLQSNDRVAVIGAGPAGSFFAIHLLREARRLERQVSVIIVEKRGPAGPSAEGSDCPGCTFCAGAVSPRLNAVLEEHGLHVPDEIIQSEFDYIWVQGEWKNFRLRVPAGSRMYSVFRGSLPSRRTGCRAGFDGFLLGQAVREGARVLHGEVQSLGHSENGMARLQVRTKSGEDLPLDAAFVAVATGINAHCGRDYRDDAIVASLRRVNPSFAPGRSRPTFICELDAGEDYLRRHLYREVYYIEFGSKRVAIEHAALIPKGGILTCAIIGKCIDEAVFPHDRRRILRDFLSLPQINSILPGIDSVPILCSCSPRMSVTTARCPFGERIAVVGDAAGCRLNKDGLFSAYLTASRLAETVLHQGVDQKALARCYGAVVRRIASDNRSGRFVFAVSRLAFKHSAIGRVMYQAFATEYKVRDENRRPFASVLWKIASGTADYREVLRDMCSPRVLGSILSGAAATIRNVLFEAVTGLKWGRYGRYPTVVLKERRAIVKQRIAWTLGTPLGVLPEFEKMYVIKIRGSREEILQALGKFGDPDARFLTLRFIEVRRISGAPNETGSVIRYRIPLLGLSTEMELAARGLDGLVYRVDKRFSNNGVLIFSIGNTRDGNHKLTVYAAFDYKKGDGLAGRMFWRGVRMLFPAFAHDVVWNHALCTIKEEVERTHETARRPQEPALRSCDDRDPGDRPETVPGLSNGSPATPEVRCLK